MDPFLDDLKLSCRHASQIHLVEVCKDDGTAPGTGLGLGLGSPSYVIDLGKRQSVYGAYLFRGPYGFTGTYPFPLGRFAASANGYPLLQAQFQPLRNGSVSPRTIFSPSGN